MLGMKLEEKTPFTEAFSPAQRAFQGLFLLSAVAASAGVSASPVPASAPHIPLRPVSPSCSPSLHPVLPSQLVGSSTNTDLITSHPCSQCLACHCSWGQGVGPAGLALASSFLSLPVPLLLQMQPPTVLLLPQDMSTCCPGLGRFPVGQIRLQGGRGAGLGLLGLPSAQANPLHVRPSTQGGRGGDFWEGESGSPTAAISRAASSHFTVSVLKLDFTSLIPAS